MMLWALWWTFDDHLAEALGTPGLGQLPIWVPFLMALALSLQIGVSTSNLSNR